MVLSLYYKFSVGVWVIIIVKITTFLSFFFYQVIVLSVIFSLHFCIKFTVILSYLCIHRILWSERDASIRFFPRIDCGWFRLFKIKMGLSFFTPLWAFLSKHVLLIKPHVYYLFPQFISPNPKAWSWLCSSKCVFPWILHKFLLFL